MLLGIRSRSKGTRCRAATSGSAPTGTGTKVLGNEVFGTPAGGAGIYGNAELVEGNIVHHNVTGINASAGLVRNNRVYANTTGIVAVSGSNTQQNAVNVQSNVVYSNATGIFTSSYTYLGGGTVYPVFGEMSNNLVYGNTLVGFSWVVLGRSASGHV